MISFEKVINARELGGVLTADGRRVKDGVLFRSAHLADITDRDIEGIHNLGIRKIIDFRSKNETDKMPDRDIAGVNHVQIEVLSLNGHLFKGMSKAFENADSFDTGMSSFVMSEAAKMLCDGFYVSFVDDPDSQAAYAEFMREVLDADGAPILWHCTQGKDRTGLGAAFILAALGADRKTIVDEFALTNIAYEEDIRRIKGLVKDMGGAEAEFNCVDTLVGVSVPSFEEALDWIDANYGGMSDYLANQLKLTQEGIGLLRKYYLD